MFTWNTFLVVCLVGGIVRRIKMEERKVFNLFGLVGARKDGKRSEWSFHLNYQNPFSQNWKEKYVRNCLLQKIYYFVHFGCNTSSSQPKKKKSYNISIVINYCNKNIPQNLFKSQFLFFQLSISFIKYTRGITKYFLSFYFFYTSYIIYCISLCCPWLVSVVLLDMLGVIKFSR